MIKALILLLVALFALGGCRSNSGVFDYTRPATLPIQPPAGSIPYQTGWKQGCESALASINTDMNLILASYSYHIDGNLWTQSKPYKMAWKDAYYFCSYHMFTWLMNTN